MKENIEYNWTPIDKCLYITPNGMSTNCVVDGNNLITKKHVFLLSNCYKLGSNWREILINICNPIIKKRLEMMKIRFDVDLDDDNCLADGYMGFIIPRESNFSIETRVFDSKVFGTFVVFSDREHQYIKDSLKIGREKYSE